jgi:hypothetical protein
MDGYTPDAWAAPFTAIAGSAAALTGLLFVALSINLDRVIKGQGLVTRAIEVLLLLVGALVLATMLLMPGQGVGTAAAEVLGVALALEFALTFIHVRAPRRALGVTRFNFTMRVIGDHLGPLVLIGGAITLFAGSGGGLYWVVPGLIAAMISAIVGAWVLLVEIVR